MNCQGAKTRCYCGGLWGLRNYKFIQNSNIRQSFRCKAKYTNKKLQINKYGRPLDDGVVELVTEEIEPQLNENQILVEMMLAPIHPVDLRIIEGAQFHDNAKNGQLPSPCGLEGMGKVVEVGAKGKKFDVGDLINPHFEDRYSAFSKYVIVEDGLFIPDPLAKRLGAQLYLVPSTVIGVMDTFKIFEDKPKGWLVQTAANSTVGRAIHQFSEILGINSIGIVRREDAVPIAEEAGATNVICSKNFKTADDYTKAIIDAAEGEPVYYGLDCIGGQAAEGIYNALHENPNDKAQMLTYESLLNQPFDPSKLEKKREVEYD